MNTCIIKELEGVLFLSSVELIFLKFPTLGEFFCSFLFSRQSKLACKDSRIPCLSLIQIGGSWNRFREDATGRVIWNQDSSGNKYNDDNHSGGRAEMGETYPVPDMEGEDWNWLLSSG